MEEYDQVAVVYVQMWGKPVRDGSGNLQRTIRRLPTIFHHGNKQEFANIAQARAWAVANGYVGIRVELT